MQDTNLVAKVKYNEGYGSAYFDFLQKQDIEGIVMKRKDRKKKSLVAQND